MIGRRNLSFLSPPGPELVDGRPIASSPSIAKYTSTIRECVTVIAEFMLSRLSAFFLFYSWERTQVVS
jgi:hypothetical protein